MENNIETSRALATRIYDLDSEVYRLVGSSLGRTFTGDKETSIRNLTTLISTHPQGHLLRSEIALIGNMARTIRNKEDRSRMMHEYNEIYIRSQNCRKVLVRLISLTRILLP